MNHPRYFDPMTINTRENCPVARAISVVGDKWSLLIIRNLGLDGPQRFQDLSKALVGISPNTLSARLKSLQGSGLVERRVVDAHPPRTLYSLTQKGEAARPIVLALREFGSSLPDHR